MDFLSYRGLPLKILQSTVHERAPQHDKSHTTYECTRWLVSFLVTYNPGAISYVGGATPTSVSGSMPPITDNAIRRFLERPRGQLIVRSGTAPNLPYANLTNASLNPGSIVICSPRGTPSGVCDVRNGPFCKVNSIQEVPGERLWKIHLTFETYVNELQPLILNNRWSVTQDINWQHMSTRIYQGICTVNAELLNEPTFNPGIAGYRTGILDSIRQSFAGFAVPAGFQRTFVKVEMTPDGNNAVYVVRDEQRHYNQPNFLSVPRIEVQDANYVRHGSWGRGALQASENIGPGTILGLAVAPYIFGPAMLSRLTGTATANLPVFNRNVIVRVWGNPQIQRQALVSIALGVAANRMGAASIMAPTTVELVVTGDSNRSITLNWTCQWGRDTAFSNFTNTLTAITSYFLNSPNAGYQSFLSSLGTDLDLTTSQGFRLTPTPAANPPMGGVALAGNRSVLGSDLVIAPLITQVLEGFGRSPGSPP